MKTKLFSCFFFCAAFAFSQARAQDAAYVENAVYVRFKATASPKTTSGSRYASIEKEASLQKLQKAYGLHQGMFCMRTLGEPVLERTFELRFDSTAKAEELIRLLRQDSRIELVERIPVYYVQGMTAETPAPKAEEGTDPLYKTSYGSWHLKLIHAEEAWAQQSGQANIKVAVVDNAIWGNHPDLGIAPENQYNVRTGQTGNSAPPSNVSQDPNCSDVINCPSYNWSHGTHTAGAVGAIRGNGIGIASIGSGITLMGVSCPGTDPSGLAMDNGFTGISWAAEHGAKVISLSWGRYMITETDRAIVQACIDKGIVIVAAAGNDRYKDSPMYPGYLPGVISVASVNDNRQISSFSNFGEWVTVASPGGFVMEKNEESKTCILSTTYCTAQKYRSGGYSEVYGQYYDGMYGTSMATPIVSGLCGLLLSADSTLDSYLMRDILMSSAQSIDEGNNKNICANSGIIDATAALRTVRKSRVPRPESFRAERENLQVRLTWQKPQTENKVVSYQVFVDNVLVGETEETEYRQEITKTDRMYRFGVRALYEGDTSLRAGIDLDVPELYKVETTLRPEGCGTVEGAGAFLKDEKIKLVAHAAPGCTFSRWMEYDKSLGRDTLLDYTVVADTKIEAVFTGKPTVAADPLETVSALRVYPNPSNGRITVDGCGSDFYTVELYAPNGQRVLVQHFAQGAQKQEIDIEKLAPGAYIAKILTVNGWQVVKIAKI